MTKFIRMISRKHPNTDQDRMILGFLNQDVPWEQLILLTQAEGVDGLLHHHLCRLGSVGIPGVHQDALKENHLKYQRSQAQIISAARLISDHLQQIGTSAIALQGLSLIQIFDTGTRPMGDMDILVMPEDRDRVVSRLVDIGYQIPNPVYPNNLIKNGLWLDVHTHVLNIDRIRSRRYVFPMDLSPLWERALPLFGSSTGILKPDPYDNYVLLSLHALKHSYSRTIWLFDLFELLLDITSRPDGWSKMIECTRYWQQEKTVSYGLLVLEGVHGITIPEWVKQELDFNQLRSVEKHLLRLKIKGFNRPEYYILLWFLSIKGLRNRLEFLFESLFPRDDTMKQIYLNSSTHNRFSRWVSRLMHSVILIGNGIKQAFLTR